MKRNILGIVTLIFLIQLMAGSSAVAHDVKSLDGKKIAILVEDNFNEQETWIPYYRMLEAGAEVVLVGPKATEYQSSNGIAISADVAAEDVTADDFDAVIIPGGYAPDKMRRYEAVLDLVRGVYEKGGVVAAICHAGWVTISAGIVDGKNHTAVIALKDDLTNAGATFLDQSVVVDGNLISSRGPADLPDFCRAIIDEMQEK